MGKTLIIAAVSARAYAQAAVACGYQVIALDAFVDADTRIISKKTFQLKLDDFVLDETHFKQVFLQLDLAEVQGFLYGSLFDACPELLTWVAMQVPVIGNSANILKQAKSFSFFALLDSLNIVHPEVRLSLPSEPEHWLSKRVGGCGGVHIEPASAAKPEGYSQQAYFQEKLVGTPISMLFVADASQAHLIGFNQQLMAPSKRQPYRFAGAVSNVALPPNTHKLFVHAAQKLTKVLQLQGICSLDAIVAKDSVEGEHVWLLELNPRLSATFPLYENLLPLHLQSCTAYLPTVSVKTDMSHAQFILYADKALEMPKNFAWPSWVADIPTAESDVSGVKIDQHRPICSVLASAESAQLAHSLVLQRAQQLTEMFIQ